MEFAHSWRLRVALILASLVALVTVDAILGLAYGHHHSAYPHIWKVFGLLRRIEIRDGSF